MKAVYKRAIVDQQIGVSLTLKEMLFSIINSNKEVSIDGFFMLSGDVVEARVDGKLIDLDKIKLKIVTGKEE